MVVVWFCFWNKPATLQCFRLNPMCLSLKLSVQQKVVLLTLRVYYWVLSVGIMLGSRSQHWIGQDPDPRGGNSIPSSCQVSPVLFCLGNWVPPMVWCLKPPGDFMLLLSWTGEHCRVIGQNWISVNLDHVCSWVRHSPYQCFIDYDILHVYHVIGLPWQPVKVSIY